MKKLSKIDESVWSDIHKRSNGASVRKEDDVNLLDFDGLYDYVSTKYEDEVEYIFLTDVPNKSISVEIIVGLEVSINYKEGNKEIYSILIDLLDNVGIETYVLTTEGFNIKKISSNTFKVTEEDGSASNSTFINLINFFLNNKDIITVNESIWSDIHKRSNGETVRKEDEFRSNIKNMKPVDLSSDFPVYWADIDLEVNGDDRFDWEETQSMKEQIEKTGWRLPKAPQEIYEMFGKNIKKRNEYLHRTWIPNQKGIITNEKTGEKLEFPTTNEYTESYWCDDDWIYASNTGRVNFENERCFDVGKYCAYEGIFSLIRMNNMEKTKKIKIRLVKDK
jgi:hypothetical protein